MRQIFVHQSVLIIVLSTASVRLTTCARVIVDGLALFVVKPSVRTHVKMVVLAWLLMYALA